MKHHKILCAGTLILLLSTLLSACGTPSGTDTGAAATTVGQVEAPTSAQAATAQPAAPTAAQSSGATGSDDKRGGRLILIDAAGGIQLDPFKATWHALPIFSVFDTLITYNPELTSFEAGLAEKWEISPDKLSLTLTLRKGMVFQDGTPVDSAAIKWNFDHHRDPAVASPQGPILMGAVTDVLAPDPQTVVLKMAAPYAPLFDFLAGLEMVSPTAYQKIGPDNFGQHPVGAGKWNLKELVDNDHILFTRNDAYNWGPPYVDNKGAPYPDELEFRLMSDEATMYAALEAGEAHITGVASQFLEKARANPNIEIHKGVVSGMDYLGFNTQHPPFDNAAIRRAIGYAINREELIKVGYDGQADPIYGPLSPTEFGYSPEVEAKAREQSYDPEKAKELLAAEGWKDSDGDGILDKDGQKMEFRLLYPASDATKRLAETVQAQFNDVGIKINLDGKEVAAIKEETKAGTHEMMLLYFALIDPRILCLQFCSDGIGITNRTRYANPELDKLLKDADAAIDPTERKQRVAKAMELLIQERPSIPLMTAYGYIGYRKDMIGGLKFDALGSPILNDVYMLKK